MPKTRAVTQRGREERQQVRETDRQREIEKEKDTQKRRQGCLKEIPNAGSLFMCDATKSSSPKNSDCLWEDALGFINTLGKAYPCGRGSKRGATIHVAQK
jgi:hypothetical protein